MNKPKFPSSICIIPKNEATFCVQCEAFVNTERCPVCDSQTLVAALFLDRKEELELVKTFAEMTSVSKIVEKVLLKHGVSKEKRGSTEPQSTQNT